MIRALLLICCYLSSVSGVDATTAPDVSPIRIHKAPAISPRPRRRAQNDKNGGGGGGGNKNDNDPTEAPTEEPTERPTKEPTEAPITPDTEAPNLPPTTRPSSEPTEFPTPFPTASPVTGSPTTLAPSLSPTNLPTEQGPVGYLNITFSLFADDVSETSVLLAQDQELVNSIKETLDFYLCADTDFVLLNFDDQPICPSTRRVLQDEEAVVDSILYPDDRRIIVEERNEGGFQFTLWRVVYPVMKVGTKYQEMAEGTTDPSGLKMMQSVAQLAVDVRVEEGDMNTRLSSETLEVSVAVMGQELSTFTDQLVYPPLDPAPLHPLRIAGISLLVCSIISTWFIMHLAKQRRIQKEWDAEFKERGKGGLVTEAGLDYMLEAGRHQSTQMVDDEEGVKLPLPGYMNGGATPS